PRRGGSAHQLEVASETLGLIVQQRLDRADVQDRQRFPSLSQYLRDDREERCFSFSPSGRREDNEVGPAQEGVDGRRLYFSYFSSHSRLTRSGDEQSCKNSRCTLFPTSTSRWWSKAESRSCTARGLSKRASVLKSTCSRWAKGSSRWMPCGPS